MFSKSNLFSGLALIGAVYAGQFYLRHHHRPLDLSTARAPVRFEPVRIGAIAAPARLAGAWAVSAPDARFGGVSALAIDHGRLLGLSDAGMLLWLDRPGTPRPTVTIRALPVVAGPAGSKVGRDSEALLRDPAGRGWWVAFEQFHSLLLYDGDFRRLLRRIPVHDPDFTPNGGIEALTVDHRRVRWLAESSGASDAALLPDGRTLILDRRVGLRGVRARLLGAGAPIALPLKWDDNSEALTAEPLPDGGTRLWIMTDNDLSAWRRTLLVAIDLPPSAPPTTSR